VVPKRCKTNEESPNISPAYYLEFTGFISGNGTHMEPGGHLQLRGQS